ncbi:MAG: toxin-antitoxin system HicB family antitoxin [Rhodocyclaceae bacterium]|nr:toxin-antitoxin system HicB family antitoxin [Rhodocyclaceae bacterium]MDZ4214250.1 toxin-antitoxin system HicB family antitoxin [Rhodocyclaceae bacterium]
MRLSPDLHAKAATAAQAEGIRLNALVEQAIRHEIHA